MSGKEEGQMWHSEGWMGSQQETGRGMTGRKQEGRTDECQSVGGQGEEISWLEVSGVIESERATQRIYLFLPLMHMH